MKPGIARPHRVFIHELGHLLDFRLGTNWEYEDLSDSSLPSTMLLNVTGGTYTEALDIWQHFYKIEIIYNDHYFVTGTTEYGEKNHYEDFADSFFLWTMEKSSAYHTDDTDMYSLEDGRTGTLTGLFGNIDSTRMNFFDVNMIPLLISAKR